MNQHTPGPWATRNGRIFPAGKEYSTIASVARDIQDWTLFNEDDARRIVACVNRLAPFTTEQIEDIGLDLFADVRPRMEEAREDIYRLERQRDELLAALEQFLDPEGNPPEDTGEWREALRVIAKAKGGAA